MYEFKSDMVSEIYFNQLKAAKKHKLYDDEYNKRLHYLNECVENLRKELTPKQDLSMQKLLGAMQIFNDYNEFKRFGNGMKYMYDLSVCLKNDY